MKKLLRVFLVLLAVGVLYLLLWPVPVDPLAWAPEAPPPPTGPYAPNRALEDVERMPLPEGAGPEDVAVDSLGRIYGGLADGRIVRLAADGAALETLAETGGRPLGLAFDSAGTLLIADAFAGLLALAPSGTLATVATEADGQPFVFTNDLDVGPDGTVYFTDTSDKYPQSNYRLDLIEARPRGRLLAYDPATGRTRTLLDSLYFGNGVAVSPAGDFLLVNETTRYRVRRYWLSGPKEGTAEVVLDNLPGFPDGIATGRDGRFWLTLIAPRNALLDRLAPYPFWRKVILRLPRFVQPSPAHHGFLIELDGDGRILRTLQSPTGRPLPLISSVQPHGDALYLGSLEEPAVGRFALEE